jgi:Tol biopolymer transport system component
MMARDVLERQLTDWLADAATPRDIELSDVFAQTRSLSQRHVWTSPASWRSTHAIRPASPGRRSLSILLLVGLTIGALVAVTLVTGSRRQLPLPVGPARAGLVAYWTEEGIFTVQPDGTGRTLLVSGERSSVGPVWSPDGTRLAYWSAVDSANGYGLHVLDLDDSRSIAAADGRTFYSDSASWSPDGKRLAFTTATGELRLVNSDGTNLQRIGDPAMRFGIPTWSPDGTWIAVRVELDSGKYRGYVIHPDGTGQIAITAPYAVGEAHMGFGWSPDGRSVVYHVALPNDYDIAISRRDASGAWRQETLLDGANNDVLPAWSNDGTRIAFIRTENAGTPAQSSRLMTATASGGDPKVVSDRPVDRYAPCWSPDDRSIGVMSYSTKDLLAVYDLVALDGSGVVEIHEPGGAYSNCAWQRLAP